jgi:hypothetical protein
MGHNDNALIMPQTRIRAREFAVINVEGDAAKASFGQSLE